MQPQPHYRPGGTFAEYLLSLAKVPEIVIVEVRQC